ncbi:hypothetical protein AVEN_202587-1 [Araneus ventricosus]|uniref:Peptidase S1 domain-containing protein n=1 Tax=Araneus ventricosus TaxID=182803 RepID=A0A4Y2QMU1_ARAVE|nr:hypothetical protein AVEN_202587-1 [Araneus ventricosus]
MKLVAKRRCRSPRSKKRRILCAVSEASKNESCVVESGSSVFKKVGTEYFALGIMSLGAPDCNPKEPDTLTDIFQYMDWIKLYVKDMPRSVMGSVSMVGQDITIRSCFHLRASIRIKQEAGPNVIEKPSDLSEEDNESWINVESNLEGAEKPQKKLGKLGKYNLFQIIFLKHEKNLDTNHINKRI